MAALLLVLCTSAICFGAANSTPVEADTEYGIDWLENDAPRSVGGTIELEALGSGETRIINGDTGDGNYTLSKTGESPVIFSISGENKGTYIIKNITINSSGDGNVIKIGSDDQSTGNVELINVQINANVSALPFIKVYCDSLTISGCMATDNGKFVEMNKGDLKIENTVVQLYGGTSIVVNSESKVEISNSVIRSPSSVISVTADKVDLQIKNSILLGNSDYILDIKQTNADITENNLIEIHNTLFKSNSSGYAALGIKLDGNYNGKFIINESQFEELQGYDYPIFDMYSLMTFEISGTTFNENTIEYNSFGDNAPIFLIDTMSGQIVNSTFLRNSIESDYQEGLFELKNSKVNFIQNTFYDNFFTEHSASTGPMDILSPNTSVTDTLYFINNIFLTQSNGANSISTDLSVTQYITEKGSLTSDDNFTIQTYDDFIGHNGPHTGFKVNTDANGGSFSLDAKERLASLFSVAINYVIETGKIDEEQLDQDLNHALYGEIMTILIYPYVENNYYTSSETGMADGKGYTPADDEPELPATDQRGIIREGLPDIGAVTIKTAVFDANGGSWDYISSFYSSEYPFVLYEESGIYFLKMAVAALDEMNTIKLPTNPTYSSFILLGWSTSDDAEYPDEGLVDVDGTVYGEFQADTTYYAVWGTKHIVQFNPGRGQAPINKDVEGGEVTAPTIGNIGSSSLTRWVTADGETWLPENSITNNLILYGIWISEPPIIEITVRFNPCNGDEEMVAHVDITGKATPPSDPVFEGHVFLGWFYLESGGSKWNPDIPITESMILYAQWELADSETVTVTFDPCNGELPRSIEVVKGQTMAVPNTPVWQGYTFKGWFTEDDIEWDFDDEVVESIILYALWEETQTGITVTFVFSNGTEPVTMEAIDGKISPPGDPSYEGFNFLGWFTASSEGDKWNFDSLITENMTLYAQWAIATGEGVLDSSADAITVTAVVIASVFASIGVIPVAASAAGAVGAAGVATQVAGANVFQQGMVTEAAGAETSGEEKNRRTVVFDPKNGRPSWGTTVFNGRQVDKPGNPNPPKGMVFSHWSESEGGPPFSFLIPITKLTHLYAVYVLKE